MDFLEILASGRYHRDMKILKILTSNSKPIDDDVGWGDGGGGGWEETVKYSSFLNNFCLKQHLVLKILLGMFFESRNSKMTSKLP